MWYGGCKEVWNWRDREAKEGRAERVKCSMLMGISKENIGLCV